MERGRERFEIHAAAMRAREAERRKSKKGRKPKTAATPPPACDCGICLRCTHGAKGPDWTRIRIAYTKLVNTPTGYLGERKYDELRRILRRMMPFCSLKI